MIVRRVAALALVAAAVAGGCSSSAEDVGAAPSQRVVIVSLPGLGWDDVRSKDLPTLDRFVDEAAIADMSTRIGRRDATSTDAYLSLGAGTRAVAPRVDTAVAVDPDETYGGVPSAELLERRVGEVPDGVAYLGIGGAIDANGRSAFGAEVGSLGDHLDEAGVVRAVIANADAVEGFVSDDPPPEGSFARGATTMLMDSDGFVPGGTVSRSLLMDDPGAAFGWRLDPDKVLEAFDQAWAGDDPAVVLVEASDLSRVASYGGRADASQRRTLKETALLDADALLGEILERVDREQDAVIVLSPVSSSASPPLGVVAMQAPGLDPGLLQSATTRRDGYVQLADVAPTILTLVGEDPPSAMEGRSFQLGSRQTDGRLDDLAHAAEAAAFRDSNMVMAVTGVTAALALLGLAVGVRDRLPARLRRLLAPLAYGALGLVPGTFVVGQIDAARANLPAQMVIVTALAALVAVVAQRVDRRRPGAGALAAVGAIVVLIAADIAVGAPLQLNTTFGYSVAVAGRFSGLGNLAFALFGAATIVLAALIVERGGRRAMQVAVALMVVVLVIEGLPMLGADVGGVVAMVPAFGVTTLILVGRPVGWREVAGLTVATVVILLAFALLDAVRPPEVQTHLARFADHVLDWRWDTFTKSLSRRWQASLGGAELAGWATVASAMVAAGAYAVLVATGRVGPDAVRPLRHRPTIAAAVGLAVLAVIGLVANDSSVAVPLTMLIVVAPVVMLRVVTADDGGDAALDGGGR
jgi:hypothetical protein